MKILLTGATGFVGEALGLHLVKQGHELRVLTRNPTRHEGLLPFPARLTAWDGKATPAAEAFEGVEAVIHLAGESIAGARWNDQRKAAIRDSRVEGTAALVQGIREHGKAVRTFICASAVGIYGDRGDEELDEASAPAEGVADLESSAVQFLAGVCRDWEKSATENLPESVRPVQVRIGIVLGTQGGALAEMLSVFRRGVGGVLGSGRQWMSWIHLADLVRLIEFSLLQPSIRGPVNGVGPNPVTNEELTREISRAGDVPAWMRVPALGLRVAVGGMAQAVLSSQRVLPRVALAQGFRFQFSKITDALADLVPAGGDGVLEVRQWIQAPMPEVFSFFSSAHNLERITPPWLKFEVLAPRDLKVETGTLIDYRLKVHGLPLSWRTRIESWEPGRSFVDTQLRGPYRKWHHTHRFEELAGGVLIEDRVLYRLPLGLAGAAVAGGFVDSDVQKIFRYRKEVIRDLFRQTNRN